MKTKVENIRHCGAPQHIPISFTVPIFYSNSFTYFEV